MAIEFAASTAGIAPQTAEFRVLEWPGQPLQAAAQAAASSASSMILRMVRAQRPHWALQPRQP